VTVVVGEEAHVALFKSLGLAGYAEADAAIAAGDNRDFTV